MFFIKKEKENYLFFLTLVNGILVQLIILMSFVCTCWFVCRSMQPVVLVPQMPSFLFYIFKVRVPPWPGTCLVG